VKAFLMFAAILLLALPAVAQDEGKMGEQPAMPEMGRPAQMDKLAFMAGDWSVATEFKMDPSGEWMKSEGNSTVEPMLEGCIQRMNYEGDMMGMPFKGIGLTTYNRETGQYDTVWFDTMGAKMSTMSGDFNDDGDLVMEGPDTWQGQEFLARSVSKKVSDDEVKWSMYMSTDDGETWWENMRMTYTRK
jgi:hypothetical protein